MDIREPASSSRGSASSLETVLVLRVSRRRLLLPLILSAVFVLIGAFLILSADDAHARNIGWLCAAFFGLSCAGIAWQVANDKPRMILDAHGVTDRSLRFGRIDWSDILGARLHTIYRSSFIGLELADPQKYLQRRKKPALHSARLNVAFGFSATNLNLSGLDIDPHELLGIIETRSANARRNSKKVENSWDARPVTDADSETLTDDATFAERMTRMSIEAARKSTR